MAKRMFKQTKRKYITPLFIVVPAAVRATLAFHVYKNKLVGDSLRVILSALIN